MGQPLLGRLLQRHPPAIWSWTSARTRPSATSAPTASLWPDPRRDHPVRRQADPRHRRGGPLPTAARVITNINFPLAWMVGNVEPYADALTAGFDTYPSATLDVIFGRFEPIGRLPITLPRGGRGPGGQCRRHLRQPQRCARLRQRPVHGRFPQGRERQGLRLPRRRRELLRAELRPALLISSSADSLPLYLPGRRPSAGRAGLFLRAPAKSGPCLCLYRAGGPLRFGCLGRYTFPVCGPIVPVCGKTLDWRRFFLYTKFVKNSKSDLSFCILFCTQEANHAVLRPAYCVHPVGGAGGKRPHRLRQFSRATRRLRPTVPRCSS